MITLVFIIYVCLRLLNWVFTPVVYISLWGARLVRFFRATEQEPEELTVHDLDWRGPGTTQPVDNEFYRGNIRLRCTVTRQPRHLVVELDDGYARLTRSDARLRAVNRHGML